MNSNSAIEHSQISPVGTETPRSISGEVAAIVLAAGQSSRMGAFKPLLPFGRKTVVETCLDNLRAGGVANVVIVVVPELRAADMKHHLRAAGVTLVINPDPLSEMSASIAVGVRALPATTRAVLINPVDHAAVPPAVVARLVNEWRNGAQLVKPTWHSRGGHPVLIDLQFREQLLQLDSATGLKGFLDFHQASVCRVPVSGDYIVRDMDTWEDYSSLHQEVFGFAAPDSRGGKV